MPMYHESGKIVIPEVVSIKVMPGKFYEVLFTDMFAGERKGYRINGEWYVLKDVKMVHLPAEKEEKDDSYEKVYQDHLREMSK